VIRDRNPSQISLRLCGKSNLFFAEDRLPFFFTLSTVLFFINLRSAWLLAKPRTSNPDPSLNKLALQANINFYDIYDLNDPYDIYDFYAIGISVMNLRTYPIVDGNSRSSYWAEQKRGESGNTSAIAVVEPFVETT